MKASDWLLLALNMLLLVFAFVAFATEDGDPLMITALLGMAAALTNSAVHIRRAPRREREADSRRKTSTEDAELDVHQLLDIDQRLEALERAEERRIRELALRGEIRAPAAPFAEPAREGSGHRERV